MDSLVLDFFACGDVCTNERIFIHNTHIYICKYKSIKLYIYIYTCNSFIKRINMLDSPLPCDFNLGACKLQKGKSCFY